MVRRVAVVGAGCAGLVCVKVCLEEGLEPVCFESSDDIGGLWRFKETPEPERSSIYRSLVVNTSKEMMCFSDFPMPPHFPNYMQHSVLLQYLRLYAEHFQLLKYIRLQTTVRSVSQRPDFPESGQWDVVTVDRTGQEERHVFDAVLVCSGHYTHPDLPLSDFTGYEKFSGRCLHSWEFKDADDLRGKRVVVVGIGNSGGDIAVEISRSAETTFLSTRQGVWVISRMSKRGLPVDMVFITRLQLFLSRLIPKCLYNWLAESQLNSKIDHRLYGLQPEYRFSDRRPLINDELPVRILQGALVMKHNVKELREKEVVFEDGSVEQDISAVVFCTGYTGTFPFLPQELREGQQGPIALYKRMFPPSLSHPTLAVLGLFQAKGPITTTLELQARWAVRVFTGVCRLPPEEKMLEVIESETRNNMKSFPNPQQAALQVDYIPYLDFLAEQVGARPNLLRLFLTDPVLWASVFFGPCTPYQYRLSGPGSWTGARQAILTQWDRVAYPFKTRVVPEPESRACSWLLWCGGALTVAVLLARPSISQVQQAAAQSLDRFQGFLRGCWAL